mmetsp:Transcript_30979/g.82313  ORF Transcript_30979/g.82313 Transcript_30979/m.82313 type:complete len:210 (+) Transcript_30979:327-956(+)
MVQLRQGLEVEGVVGVGDFSLECFLLSALEFVQLETDVGSDVGPALVQLNLPIASCHPLGLLPHHAGHLVDIILPLVYDCVLWQYLPLVKEDELLVGADLGFPVANEGILASRFRGFDEVASILHHMWVAHQTSADQERHEARVRASVVISGVLVRLRHTLREVDAVTEHCARGFPRCVEAEASLEDAHGRGRVCAMGKVGLTVHEPCV